MRFQLPEANLDENQGLRPTSTLEENDLSPMGGSGHLHKAGMPRKVLHDVEAFKLMQLELGLDEAEQVDLT